MGNIIPLLIWNGMHIKETIEKIKGEKTLHKKEVIRYRVIDIT